MTSPLKLTNISKAFNGKAAVTDVSLSIRPGEIIGFLGPNGAGKTTTLRMALGLIKPDSGDVSLFGRAPGAHAFGRIGFLPEERGLYKKQTALDTIIHMGRMNGMPYAEAKKTANMMLDKYGLSEAKNKKNKDMSKGMAQKVQLLAAIAHDPEFYILDEPFSGLDPVNQSVLENMVREIADLGRTIIFSTHVMEHAERLCDRIILMSDGKKVFDGGTDVALGHSPRRLVIASDDSRLQTVLTPFVKRMETRKNGDYAVIMKDDARTQNVLETCVDQKIELTRFEPKNPTLHDAFVALVGEAELSKQKAQS